MNFKYSSVRDLRWSGPDMTSINCIVKFDAFREETPFTAAPFDVETHGRDIFNRALRGEFGLIADPEERVRLETRKLAPPVDIPPTFVELQKLILIVNRYNSFHDARGLVTAWSAFLADLLGKLIASVDAKVPENLGPRIHAAGETGLIDELDLTTLRLIKGVRNGFAHHWDCGYENSKLIEEVRPSLLKLRALPLFDMYHFNDDPDFLIRVIFCGTCGTLAMKLIKLLHLGEIP